ncbi:MAG: polynucleotide adenylyltransferase PcnB [Treponema sp.]|nr:polynucleotide adenylyltransferase PcnB [Treponema sp.]MCL2272288.1 polynucleotide adenylyltransferase PcnB [Treponema sp.]
MRYRYSTGQNGKLVKKAIIYTCNEHGINFADVDIDAVNIIRRLKSTGHDSYIVGGAVRDLILGKKPKDFDIVSTAAPLKIKKVFRGSRIIGRRFRIVHVYIGQKIFEVATFRSLKDGNTSNTFGSIDEDVFRRDFTMNALFYDPQQQIVVDYVNGMKDIKRKQVKPVIPVNQIFSEDPVRMIRAVKYAAAAGFNLPVNLKLRIYNQSKLLKTISPSRLTEEIQKIIRSDQAAAIVDLLEKMGLYGYLQPQASKLMKSDAAFKTCYLKTMASFNGNEVYPGQALGCLFYDYLESLQKWEPGVIENYNEIFMTVRSFVLPMNPPRFELGQALRKFLSVRGMTIKKQHIERIKPAEGAETGAVLKKKKRGKKKRITP